MPVKDQNFSYLFSLFVIVVGNALVLPGVLLWEWSIFEVFYLYWLENVVIGCFTVFRMMLVSAAFGVWTLIASVFRIAFFIMHYGLFCMGHGMILTELFYDNASGLKIEPETLFQIPIIEGMQGFLWGVVGIIMVEAVYGVRKIIRDRRDAVLPEVIMFSPYGRIVVLHIAVLIGGFLADEFGVSVLALIALIVMKTVYDLVLLGGRGEKKGSES